MYIFELLVKYLKKDNVENLIDKYENERALNPLEETFQVEDQSETCEHIFMPIDMTHMTFACSKCGLVINKKTYENRNFFKDK